MRMLSVVSVLLALAFAGESGAQAIYANPHDLLAEAIKTGRAGGVMTGAVAELFSNQFGRAGALLATAEVVADLPQQDCKRLQVTFTKRDAAGPRGRGDVTMKTAINYCLDGGPPSTDEVRR
ncbi:MAG: hypothetical protein ACK5TK_03385 [Betaproteobacteria bacterium]